MLVGAAEVEILVVVGAAEETLEMMVVGLVTVVKVEDCGATVLLGTVDEDDAGGEEPPAAPPGLKTEDVRAPLSM